MSIPFELEKFHIAFPFAEVCGEDIDYLDKLEAAIDSLPDSDKSTLLDLLELQWVAYIEQLAIFEANNFGDVVERHEKIGKAANRFEFCLGLRELKQIRIDRERDCFSARLSEAALQALDLATGSTYGGVAKFFAKRGPPRVLIRSHRKIYPDNLPKFLDPKNNQKDD